MMSTALIAHQHLAVAKHNLHTRLFWLCPAREELGAHKDFDNHTARTADPHQRDITFLVMLSKRIPSKKKEGGKTLSAMVFFFSTNCFTLLETAEHPSANRKKRINLIYFAFACNFCFKLPLSQTMSFHLLYPSVFLPHPP